LQIYGFSWPFSEVNQGHIRSSAFCLYGKFGKQLLIRRKKMKKLRRRLSMIVVLAFLFALVAGGPVLAVPWTSVEKVDAYSGVKIFYNGAQN
jgi:predicted permease